MSAPVASAPVAHFSRRYRFSASHRLHSPALTDAENRKTYGKCNNPHGHGHNYFLEITVAGPIHPNTGFVVSLPALDALAHREAIERFDHTHLNADPVFAADFVPSTENLAIELERRLRDAVPMLEPGTGLRLVGLRIEETGNNSFDLPAQTTPSQAAHHAADAR